MWSLQFVHDNLLLPLTLRQAMCTALEQPGTTTSAVALSCSISLSLSAYMQRPSDIIISIIIMIIVGKVSKSKLSCDILYLNSKSLGEWCTLVGGRPAEPGWEAVHRESQQRGRLGGRASRSVNYL